MPTISQRAVLRAATVAVAVVAVTTAPLPAEYAGAAGHEAVDKLVRPLQLLAHRGAPPSGYTTFVNSGSAALAVSVVADNGGELVDGAPRVNAATDRSIRFPAYSADDDAPHAVIQIVDKSGADDLDPHSLPFRFGADFILDSTSEDSGSGGRDNGDNLLQRGLFNQRSQYKVQLDHRVATCRVKGSRGAVAVSSSASPIQPREWYRVRCRRASNTVTIVVTSWDGGTPTSVSDSRSGPIGDVSPTRRRVPVCVGGKLATPGTIDFASDQFNGRIDNVVVRVGQ